MEKRKRKNRKWLGKAIAAILLSAVLCLGLFPAGTLSTAVADDTSDTAITDLKLDTNGAPTASSGTGWSYENTTLKINSGYILNLSDTVACKVDLYGSIAGGTFSGQVTVNYNAAINGGTFSSKVINGGTINDGTFSGNVTNGRNSLPGFINGGTFTGEVSNISQGWIYGGTFTNKVTNDYSYIYGGTFSGEISGNALIYGGTFGDNITNVHKVTITDNADGTVAQNNVKYAIEGSYVTLNIPDISGKEFKEWTSSDVTVTTGTTTYTFTMPNKDVTITANFITGYDVYVKGIRITENNDTDVFGDGTVSYDPASNTLTLNCASITTTGSGSYNFGIKTDSSDLNLVLTGTSSITTETYAISIAKNLTVSGGGSLTVTSSSSLAIDVGSDLSVSDSTITATASNDSAHYSGILCNNITLNNGANVIATGKGDGVRVYSSLVVNSGASLTATSGSTDPISDAQCAGIYMGSSFDVALTLEQGGSITASGPIGIYMYGGNAAALNYNGGTLISTSTESGQPAFSTEIYDDASGWTNVALSPTMNAASYDWRTGTDDAYTISNEIAFSVNGSYAELREGSWNYHLETTASANDTIKGSRSNYTNTKTITATAQITAPSGSLIYDGTEKAAVVNASTEWTNYGLAIPTISYTKDGETFVGTPKDVGTYTASITVDGQTASVEFDITKATPSLTWNKTLQTVTYTGSEAVITAPDVTLAGSESYDESTYGKITYSYKKTGDSVYTSGLPTDAGTYEIKATLAGTANYNEVSTSKDMTLTIEAKEAELSWDNTEFTYDGKLHTPTATVTNLVNGDTCTVTVTGGQTDAGTYTATALALSNSNYKLPANATKEYEIRKASASAQTSTNTSTGTTINTTDTTTNTTGTTTETTDSGETSTTRIKWRVGISDIPQTLKDAGYDTEEKIVSALQRVILGNSGYTAANTVTYDLRLQISTDGGKTWTDATEENFPAEGVTVTLPYPSGTSKADYDFMVAHMFTATSIRLGTTAGEIETPVVTATDEGLQFTLKGFSPVTVAWKAKTAETTTPTATTPVADNKAQTVKAAKTGDTGNLWMWFVLALASGTALTYGVARRWAVSRRK